MLQNEIVAYFDMRIGVNMSLDHLVNTIEEWLYASNKNTINTETDSVSIEWIKETDEKGPITDLSDPFCVKFLEFFNVNSLKKIVTIASGSTDGRFLRTLAVPVISFTTISKTPPLLHSINEFVYRQQFIDNIKTMTGLLHSLLTHRLYLQM